MDAAQRSGGDAEAAGGVLAELAAASPLVCFEARPTGEGGAAGLRATYVSPNAGRVLGYPTAVLVAGEAAAIVARVYAADRAGVLASVNAAFAQRRPELELECRFHHGDGRVLWVRALLRADYDSGGAPERVVGYLSDVTADRSRADAVDAEWRARVGGVDAIVWEGEAPPGGADVVAFGYVSDHAERMLGHPARRWLDEPGFWASLIHPDDRARVVAECAEAVRGAHHHTLEYRLVAAGGTPVWVRDVVRAERAPDGRVRLCGVMVDVTAHRRVDAELRESEARYRALMHATNEVLYEYDPASGALRFSDSLQSAFGLAAPAAATFDWWVSRVHPDDRGAVLAETGRLLEGREAHPASEFRLLRGDGSWASVVSRAYVERDARGAATRLVGSLLDVTEHRQLEEQFRHAQKLEAVGRFAGSIAHDFNNVLTVIRTHGEFLRDAAPAASMLRADAEQVVGAADRAARLTAQLLAFSRREPSALRRVDLNDAVRGVETMLRRLLGSDVELVLSLAPTLGPVRADAGQVEQVLMNLAVNARDAMPGGGTLTIATSDVEVREGDAVERGLGVRPGRYACLLVRDTGAGMDADTRERAFEPFFTTKPVDKGTGLGLSTVYGIVRQSGGAVRLESAPGRGASFSVYLPHAPPHPAGPDGVPQTALVVGDDPRVRALARRVLARDGRQVLEAGSGAEAVRLAAGHAGAIDLLLTDLHLPDTTGPALAATLRASRPALRAVLMADDAGAGGDGVDGSVVKPFTPSALTEAVRAALAR